LLEGSLLGAQKKRIEEIACEIEEETKARIDEKGIPPLERTPTAARVRTLSLLAPRNLPLPSFRRQQETNSGSPTTPSWLPSVRRPTSSRQEIGMRSSPKGAFRRRYRS
jgi:hypothetical protein